MERLTRPNINVDPDTDRFLHAAIGGAAQYTPMAPKFYQLSDFGKTVFLIREEAEKALQEMEGKKDD